MEEIYDRGIERLLDRDEGYSFRSELNSEENLKVYKRDLRRPLDDCSMRGNSESHLKKGSEFIEALLSIAIFYISFGNPVAVRKLQKWYEATHDMREYLEED